MKLISNPLPISHSSLRKIHEGIEKQIPPGAKEKYMTVISTGTAFLLSDEGRREMAHRLSNAQSLAYEVGDGISDLMLLIYSKVSDQSYIPPMGPASLVLMCRALDFASSELGVRVTNQHIEESTKRVLGEFFRKFGIDPVALAPANAETKIMKGIAK